MRWIIAGIGLLATTGLFAVSALMNWRFGLTLGKTDLDAHIYAAASVSADLFKAVLPFIVYWLFKKRQYLASGVALVFMSVCVLFSLTSAAGFSAINRAATADSRGAQVDKYSTITRQLQTTKDQLAALPVGRGIVTIQSDMIAHKEQKRWQSTSQCTDATAKKSRAFCADYRTFLVELAAAQKLAKLETQRDRLQGQLATTKRVTGAADPQAAMMARISGLDAETAQVALVVLLTALLEIGSGFGAFISLAYFHAMKDTAGKQRIKTDKPANQNTAPACVAASATKAVQKSEPVQQDNYPAPPQVARGKASPKQPTTATAVAAGAVVGDFAIASLTKAPRAKPVPAGEMYAAFVQWCEGDKITPVTQTAFGRAMVALNYKKKKHCGRVLYSGVKIVAA